MLCSSWDWWLLRVSLSLFLALQPASWMCLDQHILSAKPSDLRPVFQSSQVLLYMFCIMQMKCLLGFLGHLLRDDLINPVKMSVHMSVRPYVRPYVRTSTIKDNGATDQIVVFVKVDETLMTLWLLRSSEVRVKVTWNLKFQKWRFSKSISSAIFQPIKRFQRFLILDQNV